MALSKIKLANKKAKHERKRRDKQYAASLQRRHEKVRNKRMRRMMIQGRREDLAQRRKATNYVNQLSEELDA